MFQTRVLEKIKTRFLFNNFFSENGTVYEIMWKVIVEPDRSQMTIQYGAEKMRFACWITRARL
jgi:hypothetical protein